MTLTAEEFESKLDDFKVLCINQYLFLSNYFFELKNEVDKNLAFKQIKEPDENKKQQINVKWIEIISEIESFEKKCYLSKLNKDSVKSRLDLMKTMLEKVACNNFNQIEHLIESEEYQIQKALFLNKTILLVIDNSNVAKLVIIDDEFISKKGIEILKTG